MFSTTQNQSLSFPPPHSLAATITSLTPATPTTPAFRTRSQKSRFRLHSPLKQHRLSNGNKGVLQPVVTALNLNLNSNPQPTSTSTAPPSAFKVPASTFTFRVAPSAKADASKNNATSTAPAMPPKLSSKTRPQLVKKGASKGDSGSGKSSGTSSAKASGSKSQANASSNGPKLTLDHMFAAQSSNKRALSPTTTLGNEVTPSKRFKNEAGEALPLLFSLPQATSSEESLVPPSSLNTSTSAMSYTTETSTVSAGTGGESHQLEMEEQHDYLHEASIPSMVEPSSIPHSMETQEDSEKIETMEPTGSAKAVPGPTTPAQKSTRPSMNSLQAELAQTPKAPWLASGSKAPSFKLSPIRQTVVRPLKHLAGISQTPIRIPKDLKFPTGSKDLVPAAADAGSSASAEDPFATELHEPEARAGPSNSKNGSDIPSARTSSATATSSSARPRSQIPTLTPHAKRDKTWNPNRNVSAAFALPTSLSPTKTPGRPLFTHKTHMKSSPVKPKLSVKPSILKRAGTASSLLGGMTSDSDTDMSSLKSPNSISSTLAALMNRTTVDPHAATQAQLSTLNQALEELDMPRPPSSLGQRPPMPRPSTSLGVHETSKKGANGIVGTTQAKGTGKLPVARPGTALGVNSTAGRAMVQGRAGASASSATRAHPPVSSMQALNAASSVEARRASTASLSLSQSVPLGVGVRPVKGKIRPPVPVYTTASGRRVIQSAARGAQPLSTTKEKEVDGSPVSDTLSGAVGSSAVADGSGSNAATSAPADTSANADASAPAQSVPLDILKDCVIFVDVKTEDGEDAGGLFVDMLRGLGAKILSRPGGSLTHIVYKSGLHSTLTKYRSLPEPKPAVVGIGWVVECVEKREKAETTRFAISLEEEAGSVLEGLKSTKSGKSQQPANASKPVQTKLSFKPVNKDQES